MSGNLTFKEFRDKNVLRCESQFHPVADWSPSEWGVALAGETGEACNWVKKLRRLDGLDRDHPSVRATISEIAKELGDVVAYADLLAARLGIDLGSAVTSKFNEVSLRVGSSIFLE